MENDQNRFVFTPTRLGETSELAIMNLIKKYGNSGTNSILQTEINNLLASSGIEYIVRILQRNSSRLILETSKYHILNKTYSDHQLWIFDQYQTDNITMTVYQV